MIGQPVYKRIYNDFLEKIISGALLPGERLPSEMELCGIYNVSRITSKRALELLADQGYIFRSPGKGSFVSSSLQETGNSNFFSKKCIGFIIPDFADSFGTRLLYGIEESCTALGYHLVLKRTRDKVEEEKAAIEFLSGAAGILLVPVHGEFYNQEILKLVLDRKPLVFVDRKLKGLAAPAVTSNNSEAAETGTRYLLELGHRNIAFFSGPLIHTSTVEDRHQGFLNALVKEKISHYPSYLCQDLSSIWTWPFYSPRRIEKDIKTAVNLLKKHPEITAAFTAEYSMAVIVRAAAESLGMNIPKDFSILAFDAPSSISGIPPITHLYQDEYMVGKEAVHALHRIITATEPVPASDIIIPAKLVIGSSTGPKETRISRKTR